MSAIVSSTVSTLPLSTALRNSSRFIVLQVRFAHRTFADPIRWDSRLATSGHRRGHNRGQGGPVRRATAAGARGAPRQDEPPSAAGLGGAGRRGGARRRGRGGGRAAGRRSGRGGRLRARPPGRVGARVGRRDRYAALPDRGLAGQALSGGARPPDRARARDPGAERPAVRPLLLSGEAGLAARARGARPQGPRGRDAAHGHRRLLPVRPPRRRLRHRRVDRLADPAARARPARLRRTAGRAVRRAAGRAARGARHRRPARRAAPRVVAGGAAALRPGGRPAGRAGGRRLRRARPREGDLRHRRVRAGPRRRRGSPPGRSGCCRRWRGESTAAPSTRWTAACSRRGRCSSGCAASWAWPSAPRRWPSWHASPATAPARACSRPWPASARRGGAPRPVP